MNFVNFMKKSVSGYIQLIELFSIIYPSFIWKQKSLLRHRTVVKKEQIQVAQIFMVRIISSMKLHNVHLFPTMNGCYLQTNISFTTEKLISVRKSSIFTVNYYSTLKKLHLGVNFGSGLLTNIRLSLKLTKSAFRL